MFYKNGSNSYKNRPWSPLLFATKPIKKIALYMFYKKIQCFANIPPRSSNWPYFAKHTPNMCCLGKLIRTSNYLENIENQPLFYQTSF